MSWTDERVALLKKLWGEGKTAAEIAGELGGVTRNAVIGKAHRLKLSNRVSPIQQNKKPVAAPKVERKVAPAKVEKVSTVKKDKKDGMKLMDLGPRMCRWPYGDPRDEDFCFCGDTIVDGVPYCAEHAKAAYQTSSRSRVLQAEDFEEKASDSDQQDDEVQVKEASA